MTTTHEQVAELLGAYALDAVDLVERLLVESHLVDCPRCRDEVDNHLEVVALIANSGAPAPDGVWSRIESALVEPPPAIDLDLGNDRVISLGESVESPPPPSPAAVSAAPGDDAAAESDGVVVAFTRRRLPVLVAAAAASVALIAGVAIGAQVDDGSGSDEFASIDAAAQAALADGDAVRVPLRSPDGALEVDAVIAGGQGYLLGAGLPDLDLAQAYQLWGIDGDVVVSLGVLGPSPTTVAFPATTDFDALALTVEVAGGVVSSEQAPALVGTID